MRIKIIFGKKVTVWKVCTTPSLLFYFMKVEKFSKMMRKLRFLFYYFFFNEWAVHRIQCPVLQVKNRIMFFPDCPHET